ncbi:carboxypeptidase regulatory-like domain-containing protein [Anaeromyxobacter sp. Fw109-5]|uniref:carboxypeptidase regulatory-like domain-containing protein n=1 Tax=Anaeromyxobacter sp. (strain Fw109-5) TaxID=404589 RepID=UPI000158A687|nr:carboxypeptidase regulatory-like domain-containing protein [Anaeromyxobacter sp. Fw109-5]ABS25120.1 PDZ/DHR/GLGF domain protein [Anaeromyxobacter sp. Fw109-5]
MPVRRRAPLALLLVLAAGLAALVAWWATRSPQRASLAVAEAPGTKNAPEPRHTPPPPPSRLPLRVPANPAAPDDASAPGPALFEGRVVSTAGGHGVPGADLTFSRGGAAASVRADPDGAFRFEPPAEGRWLLAAVVAPGFLPFAPEWGHSPVQLDARGGRPVRGIEIHLAPATPIVGRVVDADGTAIAGAEVRLSGAAAEAALVPIADRFTTDASGEFRFAAPEGAVLEARKEGFLPGRAALGWLALLNGRVTIALGPAHRALGEPAPIAGRVVAKGGEPVAGALVTAAGGGPFGGDGAPAAQAVTDVEGRFTLAELGRGRYTVTARAEGRAPATARRVRPGTRDLLLELGEGGRLRGCVRDASSGRPVAPFTIVVLERRGPLRLVPQASRSVIDPSGCYALDELRPGPAAVIVSAPGYAPTRELAVEVPVPDGEGVADAALEPGGRVAGVVRDEATGAPLAGARISVEGALEGAASTFPVLSEAITDREGRFTLAGLPRRASLFFAAAGHHARIVGVDAPPGDGAPPLEVRLRPVAEGEEPRVDLAGIGLVLAAHDEGLRIGQVVAGGGAAEAGLARGDVVLRVEGRPVTELGFSGAVNAIRGPEGTAVLLTVRRGDATFDVRVPRRIVRG